MCKNIIFKLNKNELCAKTRHNRSSIYRLLMQDSKIHKRGIKICGKNKVLCFYDILTLS